MFPTWHHLENQLRAARVSATCFHFSFSLYGSNSHLDGLEFVLGLPFVQRHKPEETAMLLLSQLERELGELHLHYLCKDFSGKNVWMQTCSDSIEIRTFENHAYKSQCRKCWYCAAGCAPRDAKNVQHLVCCVTGKFYAMQLDHLQDFLICYKQTTTTLF